MDFLTFCEKYETECEADKCKIANVFSNIVANYQKGTDKEFEFDETISNLNEEEGNFNDFLTSQANQIESKIRELSELENNLAAQEKLLEETEKKVSHVEMSINHLNVRKAKALGKLSTKDAKHIASIEKKLLAYRRLLNVYWDFTSIDRSNLCGFIRNPESTQLKAISVQKAGKDSQQIADQLWSSLEDFLNTEETA